MNILFLCNGTFITPFSGYQTRVLSGIEKLQKRISEEDGRCILFTNEALVRVFLKRKRRKEIKEYREKQEIFLYVNYLLSSKYLLTSLFNRWLVSRKLINICQKEKIDIIHIHNAFYPFINDKIKEKLKVKVVFDCHGLATEEAVMSGYCGRDSLKFKRMEKMEKVCIENADHLVCVSRALGDYIQKNISTNVKITYVPCCTDIGKFRYNRVTRDKLRRELKLQDKFVVLYAGSFLPWHGKEEIIEVFSHIKQFVPHAHLLVLTSNVYKREILRELIRKNTNSKNYTLRSIPHDDVPNYLMIGDVGLLLRKRSLVNQVAFPTKFAEYLACGLPVLASGAIHNIRDIVKTHSLGAVIDEIEDGESIKRGISSLLSLYSKEGQARIAERCVAFARKYLSWEFGVEQYKSVYNSLYDD